MKKICVVLFFLLLFPFSMTVFAGNGPTPVYPPYVPLAPQELQKYCPPAPENSCIQCLSSLPCNDARILAYCSGTNDANLPVNKEKDKTTNQTNNLGGSSQPIISE